MEPQPIILADIPSKVFEANRLGDTWTLGNSPTGIRINAKDHAFSEFTCSFKFTVPLALRKGDSWNFLKVTRTRNSSEEVIADITYKPDSSQLSVLMNAGHRDPELLGVVMKDISPAELAGRVLECYIEINQDRIFASIHNRFVGGSGHLTWSAMAPSTGERDHPWEGSPNGNWKVTIGMGNAMPGSGALPPGFGLADLRVSLASEHDTFLDSLPYQGALDHLVSGESLESASRGLADTGLEHWDSYPEEQEEDPPGGEELPLCRILQQLAGQLHDMSGDANSWALKAEALANETENLGLQLPDGVRC